MPPRFSPRDWVDPPSAFTRLRGEWRTPTTREEVPQFMVTVYLREACRTVLSEISRRRMTRGDFGEMLGYDEAQTRRLRRKLNGEYPAQLEDLMEWAAVLDRPDLLFAPTGMADLVPDGVEPDEVLSLIR